MGKQKSVTEKQINKQLNDHFKGYNVDIIIKKSKNTKLFKLLWNDSNGNNMQYIGHFTQQCIDNGKKMVTRT